MILHRGPDDEGYFRDEHVQLGFRRLSIIDLAAGHQPLKYENERYVIIFNGEIYNYVELREMLIEKGATFSTQSDTEVLIALYANMKEKCVDYLRGDILVKADRMTLAHSLELRVPFLDKEVFDVASKLPTHLKIANGTTKHILREAVRGIVPDHVLNRKKLGFPVPIRHWLKNEMYDWAITVIKESETDYLVDKNYVLNLLESHCLGKGDYSRKIWTVLSFMIWHQIYIEHKFDTSSFHETMTV
ncbi:asparagine synthase-related protein [Bacillus fungorum]|uniref:asparagine synthase-related protein n=1 Tax=Bacillus fungorum TaxID=2039284 RepID=UPI003F563073